MGSHQAENKETVGGNKNLKHIWESNPSDEKSITE